MGKKEQDIAVAAREVFVGALGDALFAKRDWLGVAENLADQVAREYQSRMDETSGLLKMLGDLGKRLERAERRLEHYRRKVRVRAERRLEHYRRKVMVRAEQALREQEITPAEAGYNLNWASLARRRGNRSSARDFVFRESCTRRVLHAEGKGVP